MSQKFPRSLYVSSGEINIERKIGKTSTKECLFKFPRSLYVSSGEINTERKIEKTSTKECLFKLSGS